MKKKTIYPDLTHAPAEVWHAAGIIYQSRHYNQAFGMKTWEKVNEVVAKYPEHFPWNAAYSKIPKEVHDAFNQECYPEIWATTSGCEYNGPGIIEQLNRSYTYDPGLLTHEVVKDFFEGLTKRENERYAKHVTEQKRIKKIWNKHYSKYELPYQEQYFS